MGNKKLLIFIGVIAAFLVLTSQVCYYQLQDTIKISSASKDDVSTEDNSTDKDRSVDDIIEVTPATSVLSTTQINSNPLFIIGDTYMFIKIKFENSYTRIEKGFNYFKILTHCIVPINAP